MINWTVRDEPILSPDAAYDCKGVFTGCFINSHDGSLTYAYTSVSALPIHHTLPHPAGCESLSLAKSFDGGHTWEKLSANPVLPCEPKEVDVTGWRDPYVAHWPSMAKAMGLSQDQTLFGIVSGGIRDVTPTTFLYSIDANDLTKWQYVGSLVDFGLNLRPSRWSGDLGSNWEVTNFLTMRDEFDPTVERDFLVMGTEGCLEDESAIESAFPERPCRGQLWMSGTLQRNETLDTASGKMSYDFGGHLDHGCLYAANSFYDPQIQRTIVWGWIPEDDLCGELRHAQGWSGMLSMPRELRMQTLQHVVGTCCSPLQDITSIEATEDLHGSHTVRTLASEPLRRLVNTLRRAPGVQYHRVQGHRLDSEPNPSDLPSSGLNTNTWELRCSIKISRSCRKVGLRMDHGESFTSMSFEPSQETFAIQRPALVGLSSQESNGLVNSKPEKAPHTLFVQRDPSTGVEEMESLDIRAWRDRSVLEVFVNGRTAISTRLYAAEETMGLQFFAEDDADSPATKLLSAEIWDGIGLSVSDVES